MQIQVEKLTRLLDLLRPVVPKKSTLPALAYIRVGEGKAVATDLDIMLIADLPEAVEPMLLPFAALTDMLKYVPGHELLTIEAKEKTVTLTWSGGTANYPTLAVKDFPEPSDMPVKADGYMNGDVLMPAMLAGLPYASTNDSRPVLSGVTLVLGNPLEVCAGDGFRLSHQVLGLAFPLECKIIIPSHAVDVLGHVFAKTPRTPPTDAGSLIPVITAKRQLHMALLGAGDASARLRVDFGQSASVVITLIQGSPPDWLALVPKGEPILRSQIFAPHLEAAIKRLRGIAKDGSGVVRLEFADNKVTVSANGDDQHITATMDVRNTQGEGRMGINYNYLLAYLSGKTGIFTLSQHDKGGPLVFQYPDSPKVLIMPMMVQWGDEPAAEVKVEPAAETTTPDPETEGPETEAEEPPGETGEPDAEATEPPAETVAAANPPAEPPPAPEKPKRRSSKKTKTE